MNKYRVLLDEQKEDLKIVPLTKDESADALTIADIDGDTPEAALENFVTSGRALTVIDALTEKSADLQGSRLRFASMLATTRGSHAGVMAASGQGLRQLKMKIDVLKKLTA